MATRAAPKSHRRGKSRTKASNDEAPEEGGTRRALWSGSVSFGLLQIPVSLHTAEQSKDIAFHLLDRRDMSPIHNQRVNATTGEAVEWKDVVRGFEHAPGEYVAVEDEDLAAANVEATQTIDLQDFVDVRKIRPTFFERPYYVAPGKRAEKAYALFREALEHKGVAAVGTVVIRTRQHLCALYPQKDVLILELLRFSHDLRGTEGLPLPKKTAKERSSPRELAMAEELIESMRADWDPEKYHDNYHDDVLELIAKKVKTGKVEAPPKRAAPRSNVVDLMSLLRKSVEARKGNAHPKKASKHAPAKRHKGAAKAA